MALLRLEAPLAALASVADVVADAAWPVVLSSADANPVLMAAALRDELDGPLGVWLEISEGYSAALAARDVATLSWLVILEHVVVAASHHSDQHADVVRALLSDDEVNLTNDVAILAHAFNRPAPPAPVAVWSFDGAILTRNGESLREAARVSVAGAVVTTFE